MEIKGENCGIFDQTDIYISYISVSLFSLLFFCFRLDSLLILIIQSWKSHLLSIIWLRRTTMMYSFKQPRIGERHKRIAWIWICYQKSKIKLKRSLLKDGDNAPVLIKMLYYDGWNFSAYALTFQLVGQNHPVYWICCLF